MKKGEKQKNTFLTFTFSPGTRGKKKKPGHGKRNSPRGEKKGERKKVVGDYQPQSWVKKQNDKCRGKKEREINAPAGREKMQTSLPRRRQNLKSNGEKGEKERRSPSRAQEKKKQES